MKNTNFATKSLLLILSLLSFSLSGSAQDYAVSSLDTYLQTYKDKHRIILKAVEDRNDLSIPEKLKLYEKEVSQLKSEFKTARRQEYESKIASVSVQNSCTSGSSGGVKHCGDKCLSAPNGDMYTRTDWMKVEGDNKGTYLNAEGTSACLKMSVAGKGRNAGTLTATFRYHPGRIAALIDEDTVRLFNQIIA